MAHQNIIQCEMTLSGESPTKSLAYRIESLVGHAGSTPSAVEGVHPSALLDRFILLLREGDPTPKHHFGALFRIDC